MNNELTHHGILGMKWGVRRTPEQLGHKTGNGKKGSGDGKTEKAGQKTRRRASSMSDDELRSRINRLNMEEQYDNLVARQKSRGTSVVKTLLSNAAKDLAQQSLAKLVSKAVGRMFADKEKEFDINDYKDADLSTVSWDDLSKVAKWYSLQQTIEKARKPKD